MKINRLVLEILKKNITRVNFNKYKDQVYDPKYHPKRDISYLTDNNEHHKFDLYFAPEDRNNCLIIDIHGGAYIFGHRRENYPLGTFFLDRGFDFIATDYIANNGKMDTLDLIDQNIQCILYILSHLKELGLKEDVKIALTGDSAGGHIALTIAELFDDKAYQKELGYDLPPINLVAVLLNCPVFDYKETGLTSMNKSANKRMFGPKAMDVEQRKKICPNTHLASLKTPLFVSTCKHDFLRESEALKIKEAMKNSSLRFEFMDLDYNDKQVGHVHNLIDPFIPASIKVNEAMAEFIKKGI